LLGQRDLVELESVNLSGSAAQQRRSCQDTHNIDAHVHNLGQKYMGIRPEKHQDLFHDTSFNLPVSRTTLKVWGGVPMEISEKSEEVSVIPQSVKFVFFEHL
jgi:hypothetical protein